MSIEVARAAVAIAIWLPLNFLLRHAALVALSRGIVGPRSAGFVIGLGFASAPWLLAGLGAVDLGAGAVLLMSVAILAIMGVQFGGGLASELARGRSPDEIETKRHRSDER